MPLPGLCTSPMTFLLSCRLSKSLLGRAPPPPPAPPASLNLTKLEAFHFVYFHLHCTRPSSSPFFNENCAWLEAPASPNMWMRCSSSDAVFLYLMDLLSKIDRSSICNSRGHFCIDNGIWRKITHGLFALFTSWPLSELWNWLYDTCWCKTLARECGITPSWPAPSRKPHVNVSPIAKRSGSAYFENLLCRFPSNHMGFSFFLSSPDTWRLKSAVSLPLLLSQLQPCMDRLWTSGSCSLRGHRGLLGVNFIDSFPVSFSPELCQAYGHNAPIHPILTFLLSGLQDSRPSRDVIPLCFLRLFLVSFRGFALSPQIWVIPKIWSDLFGHNPFKRPCLDMIY